MVASFTIDTQGAREIELGLASLFDAFGDLTPLMEGFGVYLESATIDRFDTETAPDGTKWSPSIRARQEGGKTLSDTGLLRQSITSIAGSDSVSVGTNRIYAGVHQFGAKISAKNASHLSFQLPGGLGFRRVKEVEIPARPFLGLSAEDETELLFQTEDYARDAGRALL